MTTRTLPATWTLPRMPWRWIAMVVIGVAFAVNIAFGLAYALYGVAPHDYGSFDYPIYAEATHRLFNGRLYDWSTPGYIYVYSPVFAWLMIPFAWLGLWIWQAIHLLLFALFPTWKVRLYVLLMTPFWMDAWEGNVGIFFFVAGYWAIRGNRWATYAFMALCLMIPKPYFAPALLWILWKRPDTRKPFVAIFVAHAVLALATGYAFAWLLALPGASHDMHDNFNIMPSYFIGWAWWPIGLAISAWLLRKNHPGWAGVTAALYSGTHIIVMPLFEPDYQLRRLGHFLFPRFVAAEDQPDVAM